MTDKYALFDLRYDYSALEPYVSGHIMELHHDKHHAGYVKGANDALEQLDEARMKGDFTRLAALERALAFNLSGHVLHSLFWQNLAPKGAARPEGPLSKPSSSISAASTPSSASSHRLRRRSWVPVGPPSSGSRSAAVCSPRRSTTTSPTLRRPASR